MGAITSLFTGSSSSSSSGGGSATSPKEMMAMEEAQFVQNFDLQGQASMQQNTQQTDTSIGSNEAQSLASDQAGQSQVGQAITKIVA